MILSFVELTTNTGIYDCNIMDCIPNVDDVIRSRFYQELIEDCGCSKFILVSVKSVEIIEQKTSLIYEMRYAIIPEEEYVYRREENEIQRRNQC